MVLSFAGKMEDAAFNLLLTAIDRYEDGKLSQPKGSKRTNNQVAKKTCSLSKFKDLRDLSCKSIDIIPIHAFMLS